MSEPSAARADIRIFVDADACPVKNEVMRVAERHGLLATYVSNTWMRLPDSSSTRRQSVPEGPDAADDWIAGQATATDIVVTQDIPLAGRCLQKGAKVISTYGRPFTADNIGMALAMRDLKSHLRETGAMQGGNASITRQDRSRFLQELESAVQLIKREQ